MFWKLWFDRSSVNSPHKGPRRGALMFSLICAWINGRVYNREASDLRRNRAHYDVTVMGLNLWYICKRSTCRHFVCRIGLLSFDLTPGYQSYSAHFLQHVFHKPICSLINTTCSALSTSRGHQYMSRQWNQVDSCLQLPCFNIIHWTSSKQVYLCK